MMQHAVSSRLTWFQHLCSGQFPAPFQALVMDFPYFLELWEVAELLGSNQEVWGEWSNGCWELQVSHLSVGWFLGEFYLVLQKAFVGLSPSPHSNSQFIISLASIPSLFHFLYSFTPVSWKHFPNKLPTLKTLSQVLLSGQVVTKNYLFTLIVMYYMF